LSDKFAWRCQSSIEATDFAGKLLNNEAALRSGGAEPAEARQMKKGGIAAALSVSEGC
jgi:hypothetical protein